MTPAYPPPEPDEILTRPDRLIGQKVLLFEQLPSTNDHAALLATNPDLGGTVVVARFQTAGRGQYGRQWSSPRDHALLLSVLMPTIETPLRPTLLTVWASVAVSQVIADCGIAPRLKWPNDILVDGKKICGILTEKGRGTVVGIGLNRSQTAGDFEAAGLPQATSLAIQTGQVPAYRKLLDRLLDQLDRFYRLVISGDVTELQSLWQQRLGLLNRWVRVTFHDGQSRVGQLIRLTLHEIAITNEAGDDYSMIPEWIRHLTLEAESPMMPLPPEKLSP